MRTNSLCNGGSRAAGLVLGLALGSLGAGSAAASTILTVSQAKLLESGPLILDEQHSRIAVSPLFPSSGGETFNANTSVDKSFSRFNPSGGTLVGVRWDLLVLVDVSVDIEAVCISETVSILGNCTNDTSVAGLLSGSFGISSGGQVSDIRAFSLPKSPPFLSVQPDDLIAVASVETSSNSIVCLASPDKCTAQATESGQRRVIFDDDNLANYIGGASAVPIKAFLSMDLESLINVDCSVFGATAVCTTFGEAVASGQVFATLTYTYEVPDNPQPDPDPGVVPLPASGVLLLAGLGGLLAARRRPA